MIGFSGYCISKRRRAQGHIGSKHRVSKEEAIKWFQQKVSHHPVVFFNCLTSSFPSGLD